MSNDLVGSLKLFIGVSDVKTAEARTVKIRVNCWDCTCFLDIKTEI